MAELAGTSDEPTDDQPRIDLGSLIVTPVPGSELRLQVNEAQDIVSAMLVLPVTAPGADGDQPQVVSTSALELSAYAAPRSGGLWAELRDEISEAAAEVGGSAELAAGPFGVELRRLLPVTTPDGEQGYQPSRMWVAEGPRWLLRGIVYGQAAIESDDEDPAVAAVLAAFRDVVVRRGDEAMAPGDLLPMSMPADLQPSSEHARIWPCAARTLRAVGCWRNRPPRRGGRTMGKENMLQRALRRLATSNAELESEELQRNVRDEGAVPIGACQDREQVCLTGPFRDHP